MNPPWVWPVMAVSFVAFWAWGHYCGWKAHERRSPKTTFSFEESMNGTRTHATVEVDSEDPSVVATAVDAALKAARVTARK